MSKSIIQTERQCYVTGRTTNIDRHHLVPGVANRKKAEADGLWVYLYHPLHMALHNNPELEREYIRIGQRAYEKTHSREEWMKRYHKNYLEE